MSFENPWMLWGMLATSVPVIIHMTNRTRARKKPFAALDFLLRSDKRLARKLKIKQFLVLALRMLLLAAIPLALAKPFISHPHQEGVDLHVPGSVVIVFDDSLSMSATTDGTSFFDKAMAQAKDWVAEAGPNTNFALVTVADPVRVLTPDLTYDRAVISLALEKIRPSERKGDLKSALSEAERILSASELSLRQVVILSDNSKHLWSSVEAPWTLKDVPQALAIDLRGGEVLVNRSIDDVEILTRPEEGLGKATINVKVKNHSQDTCSLDVALDVGGERVSKPIQLAPNADGVVTIQLDLDATGVARGEARIEQSDALDLDNTFFFTVDFGETLEVLVVNGAPRDQRYLDEVFFLRSALRPKNGAIRTKVVTIDALTQESLHAIDTVVLANVGALTPTHRLTLRRFVAGGGGLFIGVGDQFTEKSNSSYGDLLPVSLRSFKEVVRRGSPAAQARALRMATLDGDHPLLTDFAHMRDASLFRSVVYQYALAGRVDPTRASVLARYSNGTPALVEGRLEDGRILLLTTTLDRDWADLAIRSSFLPLMQSAVAYLASRLGKLNRPAGLVGDPIELRAPTGSGTLSVNGPDGAAHVLAADSRGRVRFSQGDRSGHYVLSRPEASEKSLLFSLNVDPIESDLTPAPAVDIAEILSRPGKADAPRGDIAPRGGSGPEDPFRSNLWPIVLLALFGLLLAETWVVIKGVS